MARSLLVISFFISLVAFGIASDQEPRCFSSFDFQEKLLEKMVVLSHRIDIIENTVAEKVNEINELSVTVKDDHSRLEKDISKLGKDARHELTHKANNFVELQREKMTDLVTAFRRELNEMKEKQDKHFEKATSDLRELSTSTEAKIARMSEDLVNRKNQTQDYLPELSKRSVSFLARTVSDTSPGPNKRLVFTKVLMKTDNSYNTETGEFVAPANGTYWFSTQICGKSGIWVHIQIYVNDELRSDANNQYDCFTGNTIAVLTVGDKVYVKSGPGTASGDNIIQDSSKWSTFMGTLII